MKIKNFYNKWDNKQFEKAKKELESVFEEIENYSNEEKMNRLAQESNNCYKKIKRICYRGAGAAFAAGAIFGPIGVTSLVYGIYEATKSVKICHKNNIIISKYDDLEAKV